VNEQRFRRRFGAAGSDRSTVWIGGVVPVLTLVTLLLAPAGSAAAQGIRRGSTPGVGGCFADLADCVTGPNAGPYPASCAALDTDFDQDIDLADFAVFQQTRTTTVAISQASFVGSGNNLTVKGTFSTNFANPIVRLFDDLTDQFIAQESQSDSQGNFEFQITTLVDIPCRVRIQVGQVCASMNVQGAPVFCVDPPGGGNLAPMCSILTPATNVAISLGESVVFTGDATDPEGGALTYEWDFGGGADLRPTVLNPGPVVFDWNNGSFLVTFVATDDLGARCTDTVEVEVGLPPGGLPPMVAQQPAPGDPAAGGTDHVVLAFNDLGMHCADLASYPMSILPPFNTLNAHLIRKPASTGQDPVIVDDVGSELRYSAASNPNDPVGSGSITSTSQNFPLGAQLRDAQVRKTDFWDGFAMSGSTIASLLFPGLNPVPDEGLQTLDNPDHGRFMPGITAPYVANDPQSFGAFITAKKWFTAQGIPMTAVDDRGRPNSYPIVRVQAIDTAAGAVLATTDAVVPTSTEVDCRDCHTLGGVGADPAARVGGPVFVAADSPDRIDVETAAKRNVMLLHDYEHGTTLVADGQPVLCASCHRSNALAEVGGPAGDPLRDSMSHAQHGFHGRLQVDASGALIRDVQGDPVLIDPLNPQPNEQLLIPTSTTDPMEANCFLCHPGKITQCFRGAMFTAGEKCVNCHGGMLAVGGEFPLQTGQVRTPWNDEPKCGSCHTGNGSDPVGTIAYDPLDPSATPLPPVTPLFAENPDTLYRNSLDNHAGVACEACHGSPHAIWPHRDTSANDNVQALQLQGYVGPILECTVCHRSDSFPNGTMDGPHGMHPVNDPQWIKGKSGMWHKDFAKNTSSGDQCAPCHGADHRGTRLARVPVNRILRDGEGNVRVTLRAGDIVSCDLCHSLEDSFDD